MVSTEKSDRSTEETFPASASTKGRILHASEMTMPEIRDAVLSHRQYIEGLLPSGYCVDKMLTAINTRSHIASELGAGTEGLRNSVSLLRDVSHDLLMALVEAAEREDRHKKRIEYQRGIIQKLNMEMAIDSMSGLLNQNTFRKWAPVVFNDFKETGENFAYMMVDIDCFHDLNHEYGHLAGDFVIEELGKIFQEQLRVSDFMFRYKDASYDGEEITPEGSKVNGNIAANDGGDEFSFILPGASSEDVPEVAERLRVAVDNHEFKYISPTGEELTLPVTVSVGISFADYDHDNSFSIVRERADAANRILKEQGRNGVMTSDLHDGTISFRLVSPEDRNMRPPSSRDKSPINLVPPPSQSQA